MSIELFVKMPRLQGAILERIIGMVSAGVSRREVARRFNIAYSMVNRAWIRYQNNNSPQYTHGGGRQRVTNPAEDRFLRRTALQNRRTNATQLKRAFQVATGNIISTSTIRKRLHEGELHSRRPARHPKWTREHKRRRLEFALNHQNWNANDWAQCLFTDESRFSESPDTNRLRVWRRMNERYEEDCTVGVTPFGGRSITVWGGISIDRRTQLVLFVHETVTALRYLERILEPIVLPLSHQMGEQFVYMDDNARPHRANIVNEFFQQQNITRMEWPALSPDLNPIENVWDALQRRMLDREMEPHGIEELANALQEEWEAIQGDLINNVIRSMPQRCQEVIRSRGGPTHY